MLLQKQTLKVNKSLLNYHFLVLQENSHMIYKEKKFLLDLEDNLQRFQNIGNLKFYTKSHLSGKSPKNTPIYSIGYQKIS